MSIEVNQLKKASLRVITLVSLSLIVLTIGQTGTLSNPHEPIATAMANPRLVLYDETLGEDEASSCI